MARKRTTVRAEQPAAVTTAGPESLFQFADQVERQASEQTVAAPEAERHLVTFLLEHEEFGIPIGLTREIVRVAEVTRVPQAPPHIRGVMNLRGRILPVVEIRTRFGLPPAELTPRSRVVVVEVQGRVVGILVDAVAQVVRVRENAIVPPPEEVVSHRSEYITGVARIGSRLIILIELDKALLLETVSSSGRASS
jgi:purine-binding chemotaxis protein CheW